MNGFRFELKDIKTSVSATLKAKCVGDILLKVIKIISMQ